jgi:hypothetical protein
MGDRAEAWLAQPSRMLGRLSPRELAATSDAGLRVVLTEMERHEPVLRKGPPR